MGKRSTDAAAEALVATLRAAGCVFAEDEAGLLLSASRTPSELDENIRRRVAGEPLEQILGWAEFCGLRIVVEPGVFVPRQRTALLVGLADRHLRERAAGAVVVDLCCGSGAAGVALAARCPIELHAADLDPAAVHCARRNLAGVGSAYQGDLFDPLPAGLRGRVEVILANAPYVPTEAIPLMPTEAREHEPRIALDGGPDGLAVHRRIAAAAPGWLAPGGVLLIEVGPAQVEPATRLFTEHGLDPSVETAEELDAVAVVGRAASQLNQPWSPPRRGPARSGTPASPPR